MVGYCLNGYRMWYPQEQKIFKGHDVLFNENTFVSDLIVDSSSIFQPPSIAADFLDISYDNTERNPDVYNQREIVQRSSKLCNCLMNLDAEVAIDLSAAESFMDDVPQTYEDIYLKDDKQHSEYVVARN